MNVSGLISGAARDSRSESKISLVPASEISDSRRDMGGAGDNVNSRDPDMGARAFSVSFDAEAEECMACVEALTLVATVELASMAREIPTVLGTVPGIEDRMVSLRAKLASLVNVGCCDGKALDPVVTSTQLSVALESAESDLSCLCIACIFCEGRRGRRSGGTGAGGTGGAKEVKEDCDELPVSGPPIPGLEVPKDGSIAMPMTLTGERGALATPVCAVLGGEEGSISIRSA